MPDTPIAPSDKEQDISLDEFDTLKLVEVIDGHTYEVERKPTGEIIRKVAKDPPPDTQIATPIVIDRNAMFALIEKPGKDATIEDLWNLVVHLVKRDLVR